MARSGHVRSTWLSLVMVLSVVAVVPGVGGGVAADATTTQTLTVDASGEGGYTTIQAAVTEAEPGDTIEVLGGTYREEVVVGQSVTIVAPDGATLNGSTLDGAPTGVTIEGAAAPEIVGLTITGYERGVDARGSGVGSPGSAGDWTLRNVTVRNADFGAVHAGGSAGDWTIESSRIEDEFNDAVDAADATGDWTIRGSTLTSRVYAFNASGRWTIEGVLVDGSFGEGIVARETDSPWTVRDTIVRDTSLAIDASGSTGAWTLENVTAANTSQTGVSASRTGGDWAIRNSTVRNNADDGVSAYAASGDWTVIDTTLRDNEGDGVSAPDADGNWSVRRSIVRDNRVGVNAFNASGSWAVHESAILGNGVGGVDARYATPGGDAARNWWGACDGPSGDFGGGGDAAVGNLTVDPYYTDATRTTLSNTTATPCGDGEETDRSGERSITETQPDRTVAAESVSALTDEIPVPGGGTVTPEPGLDPVLTDTASDRVYAVVQFAERPTDEERALLVERGYSQVRGITETARYARLPRDGLEAIANVTVVRAVTAIRPEWRIAPAFAEELAERDDPTPVAILTFESLSAATVDELALEGGGERGSLEPGATFAYYGTLAPDAIRALQGNQRVFWIDRMGRGRPLVAQGRRMVGAPMAADALSGGSYTGEGVKVGVVDGGIEHSHPHFSNVTIVDAKDWADGDTNPEAANGCDHGIHVAGTIAGNGSYTWYDGDVDRNVTTTVTGVAPHADLVVSRILTGQSGGGCGWAKLGIHPKRKMKKVRDRGAKIISNSWSATGILDNGDYRHIASRTDTWARHHPDTVLVFSNGNNDQNKPQFDSTPALAKNVIAVGEVRDGSWRIGAGNFTSGVRFQANTDSSTNNLTAPLDVGLCGSGRKKPEVYAPGQWITSSVNGGTYDTISGTSMAAPHVSGAAALFREKYPDSNATLVRANLVSTATPPNLEGFGVVNANNALFENPYESAHSHFSGELTKGEADEKNFSVPSDAEKVVVTLAWPDPGRTPSIGAGVSCVGKGSGILANDLNLSVGPANDVDRYTDWNDSNVKRVVVDDPDSGTWTTRVSGYRVTFGLENETAQPYDVVYRVVTQEPTLDLGAPDRVIVPAAADNATVGFPVNGTGAPVSGIHGDLDTGLDVDLCEKSGEFVAGTLSDGHNRTVSRCLDVPDDPGTYEVEFTVNTTNAATITGGDSGPRPVNASKTVEVIVPDPTIHVEPYIHNASIGERVTYEIVASNVSEGVEEFRVQAEMLDPSIGRFVSGAVDPSGSFEDVDVLNDGRKIELRAQGLDTDDYGNVTLGTMTAEGWSIGASGIALQFPLFEDEDGSFESVAYEDSDTTWKAILNVPTGKEELSVDVPTGDDGDDGSVGGSIGVVGEPIRIELNRSSLDAELDVVEVQWDFDDGTTGSGPGTEHVYEEPGKYTVRAEVFLSDGRVTEIGRIIDVGAVGGSGLPNRTLSASEVPPGEEVTVTVAANVTGDRGITVNESFAPPVERATLQDVTVDGSPATPASATADPQGVVVTLDGASAGAGATVRITYAVSVSERATVGSVYDIDGTAVSADRDEVPTDRLTVVEGDSTTGYDDNDDGRIDITELGVAAADYAIGEIDIATLGEIAAAYAIS